MIAGIGIDIIELDRISKLVDDKKFIDRILTKAEKERFMKLSNQRRVEFLAGRFAVKEAFSKAMGTGIGKELSFTDIEVTTTDKGRPVISKPLSTGVHVSISHSRHYAVAQVVIETTE